MEVARPRQGLLSGSSSEPESASPRQTESLELYKIDFQNKYCLIHLVDVD